MSKVTVIQCDISDLKEALLQLDKVPIIIDQPFKCSPEEKRQMEQAKVKIKQRPDGYLKVMPEECKAEILSMSEQGLYPSEIAKRLGLNFNSVKDLVYREKKKARNENVSPFAPNFAGYNEVTKASRIDADLPNIESCEVQAESPAIWPTMNLEAAIQPLAGIEKAINAALAGMVDRKCSVVYITRELNRNFGRQYTKDDITDMIAGLRG